MNRLPADEPRWAARAAPGTLLCRPLTVSDIEGLAAVLLDGRVYEHIGPVPAAEAFASGLRRALHGPPAGTPDQRWLNYVVQLTRTGQIIGRLEATVHDGIAEVAFLYGPEFWGRGHARQGLDWLHAQLQMEPDVSAFWATTSPSNERCARLLRRCGYRRVATAAAPVLYAHDNGDLVFTRAKAL